MEHNPMGWPNVVGIAAFLVFVAFWLSLLMPAPWLILAAWMEERAKVKATLAKARLMEAEAALLRAKGGRDA